MILCTTYCTHNWYFAPWYVATFCKYISRKLSTMCCQTICVTFWKPIRQSFQRRPSHPNHHLWSPDYTLPSWPKPPGPTICGWQVNLTNPGEGIGGVSFTWLDCRTDLKLKKYCFQRRRFGPEDHLWKLFRRAPQKTTQMVWRTFCRLFVDNLRKFQKIWYSANQPNLRNQFDILRFPSLLLWQTVPPKIKKWLARNAISKPNQPLLDSSYKLYFPGWTLPQSFYWGLYMLYVLLLLGLGLV